MSFDGDCRTEFVMAAFAKIIYLSILGKRWPRGVMHHMTGQTDNIIALIVRRIKSHYHAYTCCYSHKYDDKADF